MQEENNQVDSDENQIEIQELRKKIENLGNWNEWNICRYFIMSRINNL